jgi:hypothetical protein
MPRFRSLLSLGVAFGLACSNGTSPSPTLRVSPVLDSLFVDDTIPPLAVEYRDASGVSMSPGTVTWSTSDPTVLDVDPSTGTIVGLKAGFAQVFAAAHGLQASALTVVLHPLQVTLLVDTIELMPGDTFTVPVAVAHQAPGTPLVWFRTAPNAVFTVDSASGKDSAKTAGGPLPFTVFAALGADTVADSGSVEVISLVDTAGGKAGYTMFGTVIRSVRARAEAINYQRTGDTLTFRLRAFITQGSVTAEAVVITVRTSVSAPGTFAIDSITPAEAFGSGADPICRPQHNWGSWSTIATDPAIQALSRAGGSLTVTRVAALIGGVAIGGRFNFDAQRTDLYDDPLGGLPIRGTFVAALVTGPNRC